MCVVDSNAPTDEENELTAVSKYRYMSFRESLTSTVNLGFRIEGIKVSDVSFHTSNVVLLYFLLLPILFCLNLIFCLWIYIVFYRSKNTEGVSKDFKTLRDRDQIIDCILHFCRFDRNILVSLRLLNSYGFILRTSL